MTNEQLEKAKSIQAEIEGRKNDLKRIHDFESRITEICSFGIRINNGRNLDAVILPRENEITALLTAMRNRVENRIYELEKEFAEL